MRNIGKIASGAETVDIIPFSVVIEKTVKGTSWQPRNVEMDAIANAKIKKIQS